MEMCQVKSWVELIFVLKEDASFSSLAFLVVKTKQAKGFFIVDVEGNFPNESKEKNSTFTSVSTLSPIFPFSHYFQAIQAIITSLGAPLDFDLMHEFQLHLEEEYRCPSRDQMQQIQDCMRKK
jgi:hypothetical protein